jgi:uncharacterized protein
MRDGALRLRLHAPPVDGAANAEVVDVLARLLSVPRSAVTIVTGHRHRLKRVRVHGVSATHVTATIAALETRGS